MATIELKNIKKKYGRKTVYEDLNFCIQKNSITGLIGENGTGKTTAMKIILGLTPFSAGEVYINDKKISYVNKDEKIFSKIGYMIDSRFDRSLNLYENLKSYCILYNIADYEKKIYSLIKLVGLEKETHKYIQSFSTGMKQRYDFIVSIINDPEILLLDEPFANLDPLGVDIIKKEIKRMRSNKDCTILINSHNLHDIETMCTDLLVISRGKVSISKKIAQVVSLVYIITFEKVVESIPNKAKTLGDEVTLSADYKSLLIKNPVENFFKVLEEEIKDNKVMDVRVDKYGLERFFGYGE